jgi:RNA 2',3'-cyclic 3'-phosphodiesterase
VRLFIGVELDEKVRSAAALIAGDLARQLERRVTARWVPAANLHITLWFIGHVQDERGDEIRRVLERPFNSAAFELHLAGAGTFPRSGPPRVIWIGVQSGTESLVRLHSEISTRLVPIGIEPERRAYSAHLTIARVNSSVRGDYARIRATLAETAADAGTCRIAAVTLFQSHVSSKGATYEPLLRVPLL